MLGFDSYADIAARLDDVAAGRADRRRTRPRDRRTLLPVSPAQRPAAAAEVAVPGHAWLPTGAVAHPARRRARSPTSSSPRAATGAARSARSRPSAASFVSRPPADVLAEARVAGRDRRARARPGQRELDVLRQGPRRPARARGAAAASWPRSTASSASGCPTCSRPSCGPACSRRIADDARRRAVLRPVLPARERDRCCAG